MTDTSMNDRTDDEVIADYVCASSFEIDGQVEGVYNEQQLDYVFAYYWQILVPCLGVRGYEIVGIPTRADFVGAWGRWHPYFSVRQDQQRAFVADTRLPVDCPPMPAEIEDPGYANLWQQ
jgi:hypothetical protein